jgi:hypothetical protein
LKKTACILLIGIFFFNCVGYRIVLSCMEDTATARLEDRIDAGDYDEGQLIEVKIPMNLPYNSSWSDYETYYGETEYNGEHYQYVKRKLSNDTLFLLCIPNEEKTQINAAKVDFFKTLNNLPMEGGSQKSQTVVKLLLSEFVQQDNNAEFRTFSSLITSFNSFHFQFVSQYEPQIPVAPPEC